MVEIQSILKIHPTLVFQSFCKDCLYSPEGDSGFSDRQLVEHLNGNIHYQMFCRIMIDPSFFDIDSHQKILDLHRKPYLDNLHLCMADATCYESHMRFPVEMKLLWECFEWLYRHIFRHCKVLSVRTPHNKYVDVTATYRSCCCKKRKISRTRMFKRRMIRLLEKNSCRGIIFIVSVELRSDIHRITKSVFLLS